jgi:hypothetical protein
LTWDGVQKSLQVFVSFNQGASYTKVSDQKLNYNPYALYAETAGKLGGVLAISGGGTGATTAADARLNLGLDQVNNTSDAAKTVSTAKNEALVLKANTTDVNAAIALKANTTDMTAALAAKADTGTIKTFVVTQVAAATIADADASTKGKIQLAGDLAGTADAPTVPGLALKANTSDMTTALDLKANAADVTTALALKANANNVVTSLNLKENTTNKSTDVSIDGTSDIKYPSVKAVKTYVDAQVTGGLGAATISDADANTKGKIQLAGDLGGTAASPTVNSVGGVASTTITNISSSVLSATSSNTANTIVKRDGSGNFAAGAITATSIVSSGNISSTSLNTGTLTATSLVTNTLKVTGGNYTLTNAVLTTDGTGNAVWSNNGLYTLNGISAAAQTFSTTTASTSTAPSFTSTGRFIH